MERIQRILEDVRFEERIADAKLAIAVQEMAQRKLDAAAQMPPLRTGVYQIAFHGDEIRRLRPPRDNRSWFDLCMDVSESLNTAYENRVPGMVVSAKMQAFTKHDCVVTMDMLLSNN